MRHTRSLGSPAYQAVERQGEDRESETEKESECFAVTLHRRHQPLQSSGSHRGLEAKKNPGSVMLQCLHVDCRNGARHFLESYVI